MANLTKTQIKKRLKEFQEKVEELMNEIDDFMAEVEDEASDIEPYDGREELTAAQEERKEWLENCAEKIGEIRSLLEDDVDYIFDEIDDM